MEFDVVTVNSVNELLDNIFRKSINKDCPVCCLNIYDGEECYLSWHHMLNDYVTESTYTNIAGAIFSEFPEIKLVESVKYSITRNDWTVRNSFEEIFKISLN